MENQLPERHEETPEGLVAKWVPEEIARGFLYTTSLPNNTDLERLAVLDIIEGQYLDGGEMIGQTFLLGHYVAHPVQITQRETGEVVDAIRTLFIQPEGPPVKFCSSGVLKSLGRICAMLKRTPPFDPPIPVKLIQAKAGKEARIFKLQVVKD